MVIHTEHNIRLRDLFFDFLLIGSTSFGGFMALISIIEKQMVEKRKLFTSEELLDTVSVASILPGPMAVNVVTALGFKLRGMKGAMVSMSGVLIPTFILILTLSWLYFSYGNLPKVDSIFSGVLPAVCAIITAVAFNMSSKNLRDIRLIIICVSAGITLIVVGGFFITMILMLIGGLAGVILYSRKDKEKSYVPLDVKGIKQKMDFGFKENLSFLMSMVGVVVFFVVSVLFIENNFLLMLRSLALTFGGVSIYFIWWWLCLYTYSARTNSRTAPLGNKQRICRWDSFGSNHTCADHD